VRAVQPPGLDAPAARVSVAVAPETHNYDLVLMLDPAATDDVRNRVLSEVQRAIEGAGSLGLRQDWGRRHMAYPIRHQEEAEYHLFQFESPPDVLEQLQRNLRIADGVVRFRLIKLRPGTPPPPQPRPSAGGGRSQEPASTDGAGQEEPATQA